MLIAFLSATMLLSLAWSVKVKEWDMVESFALSIAIGLAIAGALYYFGRTSGDDFYRREGLAVVSLGWILGAAVAALPFMFSEAFLLQVRDGYIDAYFEAMSGITTTGSTILADIEAMPKGLLMWRSFIQWLGGMGIVVLFVAFLPALGVHAKHLYKVEVPGIKKEGATPRIRDAAMLLWKIYIGLTVAETMLLMLAGMDFFDAINHTFTTLATGGFSTKNASIAAYDSVAIEAVIILFMLLVGINFALFISVLRGRPGDLFKDVELRVYFGMIIGMTLFVAINLFYGYTTHPDALNYQELGLSRIIRDSLFQVVAIITTTGYCTANFDTWAPFGRIGLVAFMFVGGCAGSTGGSQKVARLIVVFKMSVLQIQKFFFPRMVKQVKIGKSTIPEETLHLVAGFVLLFLGIWAIGSLFMAFLGHDIVTASTSVIATLGNIGPGLGGVGAIENFGGLHWVGKIFLSFCMVCGRLELFTVLVLLVPSFWRE